ncbi:hypothetical protein W02_22300 [Nitrospira sp. KM1]|nr:hypothetical protein W02_22300 [Nitrospira sp. KM1]
MRTQNAWTQFISYEHEINRSIERQRVISLCTYPIDICAAKDMLGAKGNHWNCLDLRQRPVTVLLPTVA